MRKSKIKIFKKISKIKSQKSKHQNFFFKNQNFSKYPSWVSIHNQNLLYTFSDLIN